MKKKSVKFETPVAVDKELDFLKFLEELKIKNYQIRINGKCGGYIIYVISIKSNSLRKVLVDKQTDFI